MQITKFTDSIDARVIIVIIRDKTRIISYSIRIWIRGKNYSFKNWYDSSICKLYKLDRHALLTPLLTRVIRFFFLQLRSKFVGIITKSWEKSVIRLIRTIYVTASCLSTPWIQLSRHSRYNRDIMEEKRNSFHSFEKSVLTDACGKNLLRCHDISAISRRRIFAEEQFSSINPKRKRPHLPLSALPSPPPRPVSPSLIGEASRLEASVVAR